MTTSEHLKIATLAAFLGLLLGYLGGPVQILGLWGIVGLGIGYLSGNYRRGAVNGALFGFLVSFEFMLHGYAGADPISSKILPFALLGVFGAFCGVVLALLGRLAAKLRNS